MRWKPVAGYVAMLSAGVAALALVHSIGNTLQAPAPAVGAALFGPGSGSASSGAGAASLPSALPHVLLALAVIIVAARAVGALFARVQQPPVIGEMIAGILLGPSLLGRFAPGVSAFILPASIAPLLGIIAQVGVVLFMFLVGLELDTDTLRKRTQASVAVSHASITVPFVLGGLLALYLYPVLSSRDVPFFSFALFIAVSMSVTAFPVLARILSDRHLQKTPLGVIALTCAAVDDVTAWCLLALVVGVAKSTPQDAVQTLLLAVGFVGLMLGVVGPRIVVWLQRRPGSLSQDAMAIVLLGLLLSSLATEAIGIHALFGAFLFGAVIPHDSAFAHEVGDKLTDLVLVLFLPAFFAFTGMRTQIGLVSGLPHWGIVALIVLVATVGKFGGSFVAARLTGLHTRDAAALGVLMNTRGLMELVVLNVGLDLRVVSPTLFTMLVLMALVTTFMTTPLLHVLRGRESFALSGSRAQPQR